MASRAGMGGCVWIDEHHAAHAIVLVPSPQATARQCCLIQRHICNCNYISCYCSIVPISTALSNQMSTCEAKDGDIWSSISTACAAFATEVSASSMPYKMGVKDEKLASPVYSQHDICPLWCWMSSCIIAHSRMEYRFIQPAHRATEVAHTSHARPEQTVQSSL